MNPILRSTLLALMGAILLIGPIAACSSPTVPRVPEPTEPEIEEPEDPDGS